MIEAFLWGVIAASSLLVGSILALRLMIPHLTLGLVTAFGVGVLMSAISFELIAEADKVPGLERIIALGLLAGSIVFFAVTFLLGRLTNRRQQRQNQATSPVAIFVGTALDGVPESIVLGINLIGGGTISAGMLVAVFISNLPEAIAATSDLRQAKWKRSSIFWLWLSVVLVSGLASLIGYSTFDNLPPAATTFTLSFAAGALITMLADAMMPEAYRDSKNLAGLMTALGFCVAFLINQLH